MAEVADTYKTDIFGGMNAGKRSRDMLLSDLKKGAEQGYGMSTGEISAATDRANQQASANLQGVARQQGQMALAGGPLSSVTGRNQANMANNANALANAGALASAETERTSQALGEQRRQATRSALEREEDRAREDAQFWAGLLLSPVTGAVESAGGVVGAKAGKTVAGSIISGLASAVGG